MNAFLNQWSTRAIATYGPSRLRRPSKREGPIEVRDGAGSGGVGAGSAAMGRDEEETGHTCCSGAGIVDVGSVSDIEHLLRSHSPVIAGPMKALGVWLESVNVRIGSRKDERKVFG